MIRIQARLIWPGCAQGKYIIRARGCILAVLRWGNAEAPLADWGPFAYVPVDPAGNGTFLFPGRRGIPAGASHVWARCYAPDFSSYEDACAEIPEKDAQAPVHTGRTEHFSVLTDLHLASRPWKIRQALRAAESSTILLLGDCTNDGTQEQFGQFLDCIADTVPEKIVLPVMGNHDVLHPGGDTEVADALRACSQFRETLLRKAETGGYVFERDPSGSAWSVQSGAVDLIGLQCAAAGRKFLFPEGQIEWLEEHLESVPAAWHMILCHAPLLDHNPNRQQGTPYLDRNKRLQEIVDRKGSIIFLSGHTHVSPNRLRGNGEYDEKHRNIYLDCGSVVATDTSGEEGMMAPDWKDGCRTEITVSGELVEITMGSIETGMKYARGYHRFYAPVLGRMSVF